MKLLSVLAVLAGSAAAHSWLECVDTVVPNKAEYKAHPSENVVQKCKGYPRNKVHNGDWIAESSYYSYGFNTEFACREGQRVPGQTAPGAPMATAKPGDKLLMRFWGNGHTRWDIGSPNHRDPGLVRIFWAGKPETEITKLNQLNEAYWIPGAQANFSADTITELTDNGRHMNEKANYFTFQVPEKIQNGRHMMVWSWAWKASLLNGKHRDANVYDDSWDNAWGTCFDLMITDSTYTEKANPDILVNNPSYNAKATDSKAQNEICSQTCYRGGMKDQACKGKDCPPCWYKTEGQVNCFAYSSGTNCPWTGAFDCKKGQMAVTSKREVAQHHARKHRV
ncbi:hypothetical protein FN846DRAFT_925585 [Sphaerosporella brunnea]|uniref:Chitin-binding type-4 domain-containing protein n=1 Tax=Sphaerosporella brunnea TaxID=1250544 RepID=A0A5J5FB95_9PEZI|nr:hypothetical protein FN846DRAFT_925585 [Sphaerosporella brunnea]